MNTALTHPLPHLADQPGLRAHSYDEESDLLKRFVVYAATPSGWLGLESYHDQADASTAAILRLYGNKRVRILDQYDGNRVVVDLTQADALPRGDV